MATASVTTARRPIRKHNRTTILLALVILIPCLLGFGNKFREFVLLFSGEVDGAFAISPILNYLLVSLGFFFLFLWAILHGMFTDIERPKVQMLEIERMLDAHDADFPEV